MYRYKARCQVYFEKKGFFDGPPPKSAEKQVSLFVYLIKHLKTTDRNFYQKITRTTVYRSWGKHKVEHVVLAFFAFH